jgi:hypothetical protein
VTSDEKPRCTRKVYYDNWHSGRCSNLATGPDGLCGLHRRADQKRIEREERFRRDWDEARKIEALFPAEAHAKVDSRAMTHVAVKTSWLLDLMEGMQP